jgi:drug/metabolite transporter (DMT)-like permease
MGAAAATVYGWIVLKDLVTHYGESPLLANGWSMLFGGLLSLGHSWLVEDWSPVPVSSYSPFLYYTGLMVLTSNLICYNLYGYLLRRFTATFLSFAGFMTPLFAAAYGTYFLDETVSWSFAFSALVVFCGLGLFYIEELREGGMHPVSKPESEMKSKAA